MAKTSTRISLRRATPGKFLQARDQASSRALVARFFQHHPAESPLERVRDFANHSDPKVAGPAAIALARLTIAAPAALEERQAIELPAMDTPEGCAEALDHVIHSAAAGTLPSRQAEALVALISVKLRISDSVLVARRLERIEQMLDERPMTINGAGYQLSTPNEPN